MPRWATVVSTCSAVSSSTETGRFQMAGMGAAVVAGGAKCGACALAGPSARARGGCATLRHPHCTDTTMSTRIPATLIPGDGIGPEIVDATLAALDALGAPFDWDTPDRRPGGREGRRRPAAAATLDSIRRTRLALKGPLETPSGGGYRSSNVRLREEFKLYANLRPARTMVPGGRFDNIDLVVVRENLEGLYIGHEHYVQIDDDPHAVAMATGINTRAGCRRILEFAFEHAVATGPQEGHHRAQGQHHEGADRHLQGDRPSRCTKRPTRARSRWTRSSSTPAR
jgi:hypothetical protein